MHSCKRFFVPPAPRAADSNIRPRYAIEGAQWVWHPGLALGEVAAVRFVNAFALESATTVRLHVSADQRYELFVDGEFVSSGPHRSDMGHWSFSSYEIELEAGEHTLEAVVWWIGNQAPHAQVSARGGFICAAEGLEDLLNTGKGAWQVSRIHGWSYRKGTIPNYHVIGPGHIIEGAEYFGTAEAAVEPVAVAGPLWNGRTGEVQAIWHLHPSPLPEMLREFKRPGRFRAVSEVPFTTPLDAAATTDEALARWQSETAVTVPANNKTHVLWDLEDYYCGYPAAVLTGGAGSSVRLEWAESLFEFDPTGTANPNHKGNRDEIIGKVFKGFGDEFRNDGGAGRAYQGFWWRSGRYIAIAVETGEEPLTIDRVEIIDTRYPLEAESRWVSSDASLDALLKPMVRALQMCSHETYMDCPYYEQMMYVGDTRLEMLVANVLSADDRLTRRGIELFDWSRWKNGFVLERYPSTPLQVSLTFSLIWVSMLRDYAWWHDDAAWVRERMVGMRGVIEQFLPLRNADGLLENLPGWSFMDWIRDWDNDSGYPPDGEFGVSSIINLLFVQSLQHAADLEDAHGEAVLAARYRGIAARVATQVVSQFWCEEKGLVADDRAHQNFSEHAQCLALLTGALNESQQAAALEQLLHNETLQRTTIYFSFYLFEALYKFGRGDVICRKTEAWNALLENGLKTTVEAPEPTRSDCHAWGAHPLFHFHASLAGVRPATPGFARVVVAPSPGTLRHIESTVPHPRGEVAVTLDVSDNGVTAVVALPAGVDGEFVWKGASLPLKGGEQTTVVV